MAVICWTSLRFKSSSLAIWFLDKLSPMKYRQKIQTLTGWWCPEKTVLSNYQAACRSPCTHSVVRQVLSHRNSFWWHVWNRKTGTAFLRAKDKLSGVVSFRNRAEKILRRFENFPESGRITPEFPDLPYREVIISPYRFFCKIKDNVVWIVAVWHGAQLPREPSS